jgi:DNA replicative helicase MCM subunit Mcm2 (Cdc46/Mcm family)
MYVDGGTFTETAHTRKVFTTGSGGSLKMRVPKVLEEEFAGDAPLNVLLSNMSEKYGVSEDKTEQIVRNLKQKGVIFEPNTGYFRRV